MFKNLKENVLGWRKPPVTPPSSGSSFNDNFDTGTLNTNNWIISNWNAPGGGIFKPNMIDMSHGMLGLKMIQTVDHPYGSIQSIGAEIQYAKLCGYGTYQWTMRASSTAQTPSARGNSFSGSVSGLFNYVNRSATELDFEIEGCRPNIIQLTTWSTTNSEQNSSYNMGTPLDAAFHIYKYIWSPGKVQYFIDGQLIGTHTKNVPSSPAFPMINHWGTTDPNWGGTATPGIDRWMWVTNFNYKPL